MFHNPRYARKRMRHRLRIVNPAQRGVENPGCPPSVTKGWPSRVPPQPPPGPGSRRDREGRLDRPAGGHQSPKGTTSIGSGKRPSVSTHLLASAITIIFADTARDDLLPQQRAAAALDQAQVGRDLVGAIDGEVERGRLVERGQR